MSIKHALRRTSESAWPLLAALALLASCNHHPAPTDDDIKSGIFPKASRPVSPISSSSYSTEEARDRVSEATTVMHLAGVKPGMTVADIGAGDGYYTVRLAANVGSAGRVLAEDIIPAVRDRLAERVTRQRLDNVSVRLGEPANPKLPANSFDRIFMVHMYHEVDAPYEFLWRIRPALRSDGRLVVVDSDGPTGQHGMPTALQDCEFAAVGFALIARKPMPQPNAFLSLYRAEGERPDPAAIRPCKGKPL
jgi:ubiquinone/menaquinone biosynthesis C-methylase UbiE